MRYLSLIIALLLLSYGSRAQAGSGSLTELRDLAFGTFVVSGGAPQTIEVSPDNNITPSPGITIFRRGHSGIYKFYNYDANLPVPVVIADTELTRQPAATPTFDSVDFKFDPDTDDQITDPSGEMILNIGATLRTRPATTYLPGAYRGTYTLMINF
jgi:hypothetical protein